MSTRRKSSTALPGVETARPASKYAVAGESTHPATLGGALVVGSQSRNNLSLPRTPLIGRDHEVATVQQLLLQEQVGLLTLTGPGGIGKTRLAMQVAANLLDHFVDGVYVVSLAPISDPHLVASAIAQPLGVREAPGRSVQESLQAYLRDKQLLLVLDNFEQILAAAPVVSALLTACPRLKVLVTSRATLHLYGEQEFPVPPLALPILDFGFRILDSDASAADQSKIKNPKSKIDAANLSEFAAIDLFCQRARAVKPDFVLTSANAPDIAKICIGLDGLPLAIELAAARIKLFSPAALLARLDQRLALLTGGAHDLPTRQRTLRDEIAWSYDLLTIDEQKLFRRLAVFVGGFTLEAAQAVGNAAGDLSTDVLVNVGRLLDHNLLKPLEQGNGEPRYGMLETIREYALEWLEASDEVNVIRHRYAHFFLALAEATAIAWEGPDQRAALKRLMLEHDNLRAVLTWTEKDAARKEIALRLVWVLRREFWILSEARRWTESALTPTTATDGTETRARVLAYSGTLAYWQGDYPTAQIHLNEAATSARQIGAQVPLATSLLGFSWLSLEQQDYTQAVGYLEESLVIARMIGEKYRIGGTLIHLGSAMCEQQDYGRAQSLYEEGLALFLELGVEMDIADTLHYLGQTARLQGDYPRAWKLFRESLTRWRALGISQWRWNAECLDGIATICTILQQFVDAVRLAGAADALRKLLGIPEILRSRSAFVGNLAAAHAQLDDTTFATAWAEGHTLSAEQATDYALALPEILATASPLVGYEPAILPQPTYPAGLTAREFEVLRLLAQGLTYAQIADKLVVSRRTVNAHATSIYSKLGVTSRAMATRLAVEQRLV